MRRIAALLYIRLSRVPALTTALWHLRNLYRRASGKPALTVVGRALGERLPTMADEALYHRLVADNVVRCVTRVTAAFHERLGVQSVSTPVGAALVAARGAADEPADLERARSEGSPLVRFEAAWWLFEEGQHDRAMATFSELIASTDVAERASSNTYFREAYLRSGEMVAREAERRGDSALATSVYRDVLSRAPDGLNARRLCLLLWRQGRLREAMRFADQTLVTAPNAASKRLGQNAHLKAFVARLHDRAQ